MNIEHYPGTKQVAHLLCDLYDSEKSIEWFKSLSSLGENKEILHEKQAVADGILNQLRAIDAQDFKDFFIAKKRFFLVREND